MQLIKIKRKKGDVCPICEKNMWGNNFWVRYHVRYNPPIQILACRYCNYTEWAIRNNKKTTFRKENPTRTIAVKNLMFKYGMIK